MRLQTRALLDAIAAGDLESVRRQVQLHPELAATRDESGVSAILFALYRGRADIADILLAAGTSLDVFDAAAVGRASRLRRLINVDRSAVRAFSADGFTALHFAAFFNQPKTAELLIVSGADVNVRSHNAMAVCPLHSAVAVRASTIVGLLLASGADPNAAQQGGVMPLHEAAAHNDVALLEALLNHGAHRDSRLDDGRTPADVARERGAADALALLEAGQSRSAG